MHAWMHAMDACCHQSHQPCSLACLSMPAASSAAMDGLSASSTSVSARPGACTAAIIACTQAQAAVAAGTQSMVAEW